MAMMIHQTFIQQGSCPSYTFPSSPVSRKFIVACTSPLGVVNGKADSPVPGRSGTRLGLPNNGCLYSDTLNLLKECQLTVKQPNPRQYCSDVPQFQNLEVWFQQPTDIVTKLLSGDLDLGIIGLDTVCEYGQGREDLIIVHDTLNYGGCHISIAVPNYGIFENITSLKELAEMPQWTAEKPLRVATKYIYLGPKFMNDNGFKHVMFSTTAGTLVVEPAIGRADVILDTVTSGTTLKANSLKEIKNGIVLQSQAVLVASRKSLTTRKGVLNDTHEILERLEARLRASGQFMVTANMRGSSAEEVAERILSQSSLSGLQGPTVSPVFCERDGKPSLDYFAINICVPKMALFKSIQQLRAIGGSGVLVSPLTYIFEEETPKWRHLLGKLGL